MTDNGRRSFSRERNRRPRALPFQRQYAAALPPRLDRDRELLHGLRERLHLHVQAGEVVLRGVVGAPLSGVSVNDELPPRGRGGRPETVLPRWQPRPPPDQIG